MKRSSEEIAALKSQHQLILDAAGEGIYGLDSEGLISFSNDAATAILGWELDDVLGQPSHEIHHHSHADGSNYPRSCCPIYASIRDGEVHRVEDEVFWHTDGHPVPVEYTSTPILVNGESKGAVIVFRDISERKIAEQQRSAAYREIKQLKERLEQERDFLREEVNSVGKFGDILGESTALLRTLAQVEAVAETNASVLILGESGVGKELVARAIHDKSRRADRALVKVNCASVPGELFESEFFGHVRGSFTGAHRDRVGRLQLADGGTLFLDEVGEIPLAQQGKLLRALQEGEFERVGDETTQRVDTRVIAATNRNLLEEVSAGRFREDLYYRLSVFPVDVPPLRERLSDVPMLAKRFLSSACKELGREGLQLGKLQLEELQAHSWPGNVRELKNTIERAVISSRAGILRLDLALAGSTGPRPDSAVAKSAGLDAEILTQAEVRAFQKANIEAALRQCNGKTWGDSGAAKLLGMKPSTLAYQMKMMDIVKARS